MGNEALKRVVQFVTNNPVLFHSPSRLRLQSSKVVDDALLSVSREAVVISTKNTVISILPDALRVLKPTGFQTYQLGELDHIEDFGQFTDNIFSLCMPIIAGWIHMLEEAAESDSAQGVNRHEVESLQDLPDYQTYRSTNSRRKRITNPKKIVVLRGLVPEGVNITAGISHKEIAVYYHRPLFAQVMPAAMAKREMAQVAKAVLVKLQIGWMYNKVDVYFSPAQLKDLAEMNEAELLAAITSYFVPNEKNRKIMHEGIQAIKRYVASTDATE